MKKSLCLLVLLAVAALGTLPAAGIKINDQKENIVITEEPLRGDTAAAQGIKLQILSHWAGHLLWNTEYVIGSGQSAESSFSFSSPEVLWTEKGRGGYADIFIKLGANFGTVEADGANADQWVQDIVDRVAAGDTSLTFQQAFYGLGDVFLAVISRTEAGEKHKETIKLSDYYQYYPLNFQMMTDRRSRVYFYDEYTDFFTELFHIKVPEDHLLEVEIEKDAMGRVVAYACRNVSGEIMPAGICDFGEDGVYYTYYCEDYRAEERVDCGENSGIFYLPYAEKGNPYKIDPERIQRVGELPEDVRLGQMLLEESENRLCIAARGSEGDCLLVYGLGDGEAVLTQRIPLLDGERDSLPYFGSMTREEGGILLKWQDGSFSFLVEEDGAYHLWCSGSFVAGSLVEGVDSSYANPFPWEHTCAFDGQRLALAAYDGWETVNVLLAVYGPEGELYCGRYHHSGELDVYTGYYNAVTPVGARRGAGYMGGVLIDPLHLDMEE